MKENLEHLYIIFPDSAIATFYTNRFRPNHKTDSFVGDSQMMYFVKMSLKQYGTYNTSITNQNKREKPEYLCMGVKDQEMSRIRS
jgi:hypothetical protein